MYALHAPEYNKDRRKNMERNIKKRKSIRLKDYDYSDNGCYFITICTKNRKNILSEIIVGARRTVPKR